MKPQIHTLPGSISAMILKAGKLMHVACTRNPASLWILILIMSFGFSLGLWIQRGPRDERIVYFASVDGRSIKAETRMIFLGGNQELRLRRYVSEFLAGPVTAGTSRGVRRDISLVSLVIGQHALYLDFSATLAESYADSRRGFDRALRRNLSYSGFAFSPVKVSIQGEPPRRRPR